MLAGSGFRNVASICVRAPDGSVEQSMVIGDGDGNADIGTGIEALQQAVDHALDLANFLGIVAQLGDCVEFIEQQKAAVTIGEAEQVGNIARCSAKK
jgi:hypothetical protein